MSRDFGFVAGAPVNRLATSSAFAVASAAAIGGLTLIEPRHLGPGAQAAYRITTAALTGAYTAATLPLDALQVRATRSPSAPRRAVPPSVGPPTGRRSTASIRPPGRCRRPRRRVGR